MTSTAELFHGVTTGSRPSGGCIGQTRNVALPSGAAGRPAGVIDALHAEAPARPRSARIAIKARGKILLVEAEDVIAVEARGNYILLLLTSGSHKLRESISMMEEKLNRHGFLRIHRSVLVNAALVEEIQPWPTGEYVLRIKGGKEYTVTRTYKKNLQLLAQSWIGTDGFAAE